MKRGLLLQRAGSAASDGILFFGRLSAGTDAGKGDPVPGRRIFCFFAGAETENAGQNPGELQAEPRRR